MASGLRCWVVIAQAPLASIATVPPASAVTPAAVAPDFRKLRRVTLTRLSMVLMRVSSLGDGGLIALSSLFLPACFCRLAFDCLALVQATRFSGIGRAAAAPPPCSRRGPVRR